MAFDHIVFPLMVERGTSSLEFSTTIIPTGSGAEQRIGNWLDARVTFNAGMGVRSKQDIITLVKFFRARKGRLRGFLVKDLLDHSASGDAIGVGNNSNKVFQLQRVYSDVTTNTTYGTTGNTDNRPIYKPIQGTVNVYKGVTLQSQGGYGAYATATITTDVVATPTVTNGGSGYTSNPTVVFTGGGGTGAAANAVRTGNIVTSIVMTNNGTGYTSAPTISFTGGSGSGATATTTLTGRVSAVTLANGGTGYGVVVPTVSFSGGGGTGASVTATISGGIVTGFTSLVGGSGYTTAPTIDIISGNGDYALNYKTGVVTFAAAPATDVIVSWTGDFYIPCRFAEDALPADEIFYDYLEGKAAGGIPDILILETRDYL
jgi:uncharacterized protein (TIGR02217 family)